MNALLLIVTILFMLVGIVGSLLPVVPGTILVGLAALSYAWVDGFQTIGPGATFVIVTLALIGGTSDLWLPLLGAKGTGASMKTILFGIIGSIVGFIAGSFIPVLGSLIGGLVGYLGGLFLAEYMRENDPNKAFKAMLGGFAGWGLATLLQVAMSITLFVIFLMIVF